MDSLLVNFADELEILREGVHNLNDLQIDNIRQSVGKRIGEVDPVILRDLLQDPDAEVRIWANVMLTQLGRSDQQREIYQEILTDKRAFIRAEALNGVSILSGGEILDLVQYLGRNQTGLKYDQYDVMLNLLTIKGDQRIYDWMGIFVDAPGVSDEFLRMMDRNRAEIKKKLSLQDEAAIQVWERQGYAFWRAMRGNRGYRSIERQYVEAAKKSSRLGDVFHEDFLRYRLAEQDPLAVAVIAERGMAARFPELEVYAQEKGLFGAMCHDTVNRIHVEESVKDDRR